jgi:hypothetical protein
MSGHPERKPLGSPPSGRGSGAAGNGEPDAEESPDFADEHTDTTVGDGVSDHSDAGQLEPESPRGLGGMDLHQDPLREL